MNKKGFTLIELLVVISIIALLMAILVPALRAAKQTATGAKCLANQHALAMAWFTYTVEQEGKIVPGDVLDAGSYTPSRRGECWVDPPVNETGTCVASLSTGTLEDEKRGISWGALFDYTKDVDLYNCPGDKRHRRPPTTPGPGMRTGGFRSYSIAECLNGAHSGSAVDYNLDSYSQIRKPSERYVFIEEKDPRGYNRGGWVLEHPDNITTAWEWIDPVAAFHVKKSTLGWADGHATMERWIEKVTIDMAEEEEWEVIQAIRKDLTLQRGNRDLIFMKKHFPHLGTWK